MNASPTRRRIAVLLVVLWAALLAASPSSAASSISGTEGSQFSGQVATDTSGCTVFGHSVVIDWGDGTAPAAGSVGSGGAIDGTHTYAEEGSFNASASWQTDCGPGSAAFTAGVADASLSVSATAIGASAGQPFGGQVAVLSDADPAGAAGDYTASVDWGDGTTSTGTVAVGAAGFTVTGSHTYAAPGMYPLTVTAADAGGATASAQASASVTTAPTQPCVQLGCGAGGGGGVGGGGGGPSACPALPTAAQDPHDNWRIVSDPYNVDRATVLQFVTADSSTLSVTYSGCATMTASSPLQLFVPPGVLHAHQSALPGGGGGGHAIPPFVRDGFTHGALITFSPLSIVSIGGLALHGNITLDTYTGEIYGQADIGPETATSADPNIPNYPGMSLGLLPRIGHADLTASPWYLGGSPGRFAVIGTVPGRGDVGGFHYGDLTIVLEPSGDPFTPWRTDVDSTVTLPSIFSDPMTGKTLQAPDDLHLHELFTPAAGGLTPIISGPAASALGTGDGHETRDRSAPPRPRAHAADAQCPAGIGPLDIDLGVLPLRGATFGYDPTTGSWLGCATVEIFTGTPEQIELSAHFAVKDGALVNAGGELAGDIPITPLVTLNDLTVNFFSGPPTRFTGTVQLTVAQIIGVTGNLFAVFAGDGHCYAYNNELGQPIDYPPPFCNVAFGLSGSASLPLLPNAASGYGLLVDDSPLYIEGGAGIDFKVRLFKQDIGEVYGNIHGWVQAPRFNFEADIGARLFGLGIGSARVDVSSVGIAGCAEIGYATVGFGHAWDGSNDNIYWPFPVPPGVPGQFGGCDQEPWRAHPVHPAHSADAAGSGLAVRRGLPFESIQLVGNGGPPAVTITGPGGASFSTPNDGTITGRSGGFAYFRPPHLDRTFIAIDHPAAGIWTVNPQPGSPPIAQMLQSDGLPPAHITAHVVRRGKHFLLVFRARRRPGQTITFLERGRGAAKVLGSTRNSSGTLRFTPSEGPAGLRTIVAQIAVSGMPDPDLTAARYRAPAPPRPGRPRDLALARRRSGLVVRWAASSNATGYLVSLHATDGRRLAYILGARARSLTVPGFALAGADVLVAGTRHGGAPGPAAHARLAPAALPGPIRGLRLTTTGSQLHVTWRPPARAIRYRVILRLGRGPTLQIETTARQLSLMLRLKHTTVAVTVLGMDTARRTGRAATARLTLR